MTVVTLYDLEAGAIPEKIEHHLPVSVFYLFQHGMPNVKDKLEKANTKLPASSERYCFAHEII